MNYLNKKVIVRCDRAGVFYGTITEFNPTTAEATIKDCRRLWYWEGAASLSQLAVDGVKVPNNCKFSVVVPEMCVMQVIEVIPCSKEAIKSIEDVKVWEV